VAFHVEISSGLHRARVFNLDREDMVAKVVEPWLESRTIEMGDHRWEPRECILKILDGPRMESPDLAFGQGWANAERASENVTRQELDSAPPPSFPDAFVVETDSPETVVAEAVSQRDGWAIPWSEARAKLDGRDPEVAAVILVLRKPEPGTPRS
jgi:hypothetical protein